MQTYAANMQNIYINLNVLKICRKFQKMQKICSKYAIT